MELHTTLRHSRGWSSHWWHTAAEGDLSILTSQSFVTLKGSSLTDQPLCCEWETGKGKGGQYSSALNALEKYNILNIFSRCLKQCFKKELLNTIHTVVNLHTVYVLQESLRTHFFLAFLGTYSA